MSRNRCPLLFGRWLLALLQPQAPIPGTVPLLAMKLAMSTCWLSTCRFLMQPTKCRVRTGKLSGRSGTPPSSRGPVRSRDLERNNSGDVTQSGLLVALLSSHVVPPGQKREGPQSPRGPAGQHHKEGRHPRLDLLSFNTPHPQTAPQGPALMPQSCQPPRTTPAACRGLSGG